MNKKNIYSKKKGFTLIELMLVVSIILVLMGFLIPKFSSYEEKAKITKAVSTAKQIQTAAMASYGDNEGTFNSTDVKSNVESLTSAESVNVENLLNDGQSIDVTYQSDGKDCKVTINAEQNSFTVNYGDETVYPKNITKK
ncbi:type II secretion system protein [Clostridium thailandense]|uniref:Prepilin-type N-terminal cleavage/methylation domain-containing protein n=1 Tax=Clostridium thailandense TaxID=2794346 RepID=A0A949X546_9CLOT|nr:prepilin-type N-terminal cleavage/methylation domain-containing protein [Clostridium thailandense]MBV7275043.1 prepilin-type N-terminal cleavage/methylation domain-containing protein [Clostridium thailandense]MCH5136557.1 prepilin-type N-terminal cleavage/methylation domain-containing protein [Clostridiaceae bacterium UIB06]